MSIIYWIQGEIQALQERERRYLKYPRRYLKDMVFRDTVLGDDLGSAGLMVELDDLKAIFKSK